MSTTRTAGSTSTDDPSGVFEAVETVGEPSRSGAGLWSVLIPVSAAQTVAA
jgi:hypothetical protein